jgi:tripartite-type tricarboxylate transporter receptor subunit TctC
MMIRRRLMTALLAAVPLAALAQYPDKPITFIVPFAAGSGTDQLARALAQAVTAQTNEAVIVDDKPGANAFIGAEAAARAPKDGYTVFITTNTTQAANEHLYKKLPYDPVKDFEPVTLLCRGNQVLVVNNVLPVANVADLVKLAKSRPAKLTFGYGSSSSRIAAELFKQMTGTDIVGVPYRSNPQAMTDLLGGQIDMMITDMPTGLAPAKAGKVKALGVSTARRTALAPELPTISEAGVPGYEMGFWAAAYVPAGTPATVVRRLNEILLRANASDVVVEFYARSGFDALAGTPGELRAFQAQESEKWRRIITAAGIAKE